MPIEGTLINLDLYVAVPVVNRLGAPFAELMYPLPLTLDVPAGPPGGVTVVQAALELSLGSQLVPVDIEIPLTELLAADGYMLVHTLPVCLEPVEQLERLEIERGPSEIAAPNVPRRVVTIER